MGVLCARSSAMRTGFASRWKVTIKPSNDNFPLQNKSIASGSLHSPPSLDIYSYLLLSIFYCFLRAVPLHLFFRLSLFFPLFTFNVWLANLHMHRSPIVQQEHPCGSHFLIQYIILSDHFHQILYTLLLFIFLITFFFFLRVKFNFTHRLRPLSR